LQLGEGFIEHLTALRTAWGKPLIPNSCCRCIAHNKAEGGASGSFHQMRAKDHTGIDGCVAIDISTIGWSGSDRWHFIALAMNHGWSFGISKKGFIHIDRRADYPGTIYYAQPSAFPY